MSAHVNQNASKKDLKQVKQYLEIMDPKAGKRFGEGRYIPWHSDGKSRSKTNITFQTMSMYTSGQLPKYITIVAKKRKTEAYVTYESPTWSDSETSTKTIIDEMIKAIEVKSRDREVTTGRAVTMPAETTQRFGQESTQVTSCPRLQYGHPRSAFGVNMGEPSILVSEEVGEIVELHAGENKGGEATTGPLMIPMEPSQGSGQELTQMTICPGLQFGHPRSGFGVNLGEPSRLISKEVGEHPDIMELHAGEVRCGKTV